MPVATIAHGVLRVLVHGASGRMGQEIIAALAKAPDTQPVAAVRRQVTESMFPLPDGGSVPLSKDIDSLVRQTQPQAAVDFTNAGVCMGAARILLPLKVPLVTGTTGLSHENLRELEDLANKHDVGVIVAPNFALGAVLLIEMARQLGRFFEYAEIIEAHHEAKADAPSGTALAIADALAEGKNGPFTHPDPEAEQLPGSRGGVHQGVGIHALRMPGQQAHHEVILGAFGQTVSLRHDALNRECYMPSVLMALRKVVGQKGGLTVGLDKLLPLGGTHNPESSRAE
jgi:4-hydroxy-tetrahydrodipicolinate reductase